jgi:hypothetical protein
VTTTTRAYADPVDLDITGNVDIDAISSIDADSTTEGKALSVAFSATSNVITEATANVMPTVESRLGGYADDRERRASGTISVGSTLAASATVLVDEIPFPPRGAFAPVAIATIAPTRQHVTAWFLRWIGGNIVSTSGDITVKSIYNQDLSRGRQL